MTPCMTEENSEFSEVDLERREALQKEKEEKSKLTEDDIRRGIKVLERRSLAWRSRKVSVLVLAEYCQH